MLREQTVAGRFYPSNKTELSEMVKHYIKEGKGETKKPVKAIVAPHAGYIFSGPVAGSAYKQFSKLPKKHYNIFLVGASHHDYITCSIGNFDAYQTPLGDVPVNHEICEELIEEPSMSFVPQGHVPEHSLETQLPFLQETFDDFSIVPVLCGNISPEILAQVLEPYFESENNLFVFSSDLSHYMRYGEASLVDQTTLDILTTLRLKKEYQMDACGKIPLQALMRIAINKRYKLEVLDYRNSGDTAGDKDRVVGYAAVAVS